MRSIAFQSSTPMALSLLVAGFATLTSACGGEEEWEPAPQPQQVAAGPSIQPHEITGRTWLACGSATCRTRGELRFIQSRVRYEPIYALHFQASGRLLLASRPVASFDPDLWPSREVRVAKWALNPASADRAGSLDFELRTDRPETALAARVEGDILHLDFSGYTGKAWFLGEHQPAPLDARDFLGTLDAGEYTIHETVPIRVFFTFKNDGSYFVTARLPQVRNVRNTYEFRRNGLTYACVSEGRWALVEKTLVLEVSEGHEIPIHNPLRKGYFSDIWADDVRMFTAPTVADAEIVAAACPATGPISTTSDWLDASTW